MELMGVSKIPNHNKGKRFPQVSKTAHLNLVSLLLGVKNGKILNGQHARVEVGVTTLTEWCKVGQQNQYESRVIRGGSS